MLGGHAAVISDASAPTWMDVGCGNGALTMTASDFGFATMGLDARADTVSRIASLGFNAQLDDFMQIEFKKKLDVLSMMDVLDGN
jgi:protein O-GlcNAc transferase